MSDILNEAENLVKCKECQWYKNCLTPMRLNVEDIQRQIDDAGNMGLNMSSASADTEMIAAMASAAQNSLVEACPVFIDRLRNDQRLSQRVKELMRDWGSQE